MTALQLVNKVIVEKLKFNSVSTIAGATGLARQVLWAINEIQKELANAYDWNDLKKSSYITLVAAQDTYSLASDVLRIIPDPYYQIDDGSASAVPEFQLVSDEVFLKHDGVNIVSGRPYIGREIGRDSSNNKQIQVYGAPTTSYAGTKLYYDYIKQPTDLAAGTDMSPFDDLYLIEGAYMKLKENQGRLKPENIQDYINDVVNGVMMNTRRKRHIAYRDIE